MPEQHSDNAFVKHSVEYQNEQEIKGLNFKLTIVASFVKTMEREVCKGVVRVSMQGSSDLPWRS